MTEAVLVIHSQADLEGQSVSIIHVVERGEGGFLLLDERKTLIAASPDPKRLSKFALANGAKDVRHGYDLRLAE